MVSRVLLKSAQAFRPALVASSRQVIAQRTFTASAMLSKKESAATNDKHDEEHHKQDALKKQAEGKGHWKPELASDSEEAVKADRHAGEEDVAKLQERTKKAAEEAAKSGTSMRDGL